MQNGTDLLDPRVLSSIDNLELIARKVVEGFITGLHKSPFHGFSVEFSQHRPYMQGDSLRFIDWKVYARSDRYYVKQFEEETNLRCFILLDASGSMAFSGNGVSKFRYASMLASALTYLMLKQRDATGLVLFDEDIRQFIPPRSVHAHLKNILGALSDTRPEKDTRITGTLHQLADKIKRRSMVILISDFFDDPDEIKSGIKHLLYNKHELLVFQILDDAELGFDYKGEVEFRDLEGDAKIKTRPKYIKDHYLEQITRHNDSLKHFFSENRVDYGLIKTSDNLSKAMLEYALKRNRLF